MHSQAEGTTSSNMHNYIEGTKGWHAVCCCASIDIRHEGSISYTCIVRQKGQQVWHEHVVVLAYILFRTKKTKGHAAMVLAGFFECAITVFMKAIHQCCEKPKTLLFFRLIYT